MIPRGADGLRNIIMRMAIDLMPKASDAYMASDLGMLSALLGMVAQDYDRAADVLVAEHAALVPILEAGSAKVEDAALQGRIGEALAIQPASLRVSDLQARSDAMLRALIDLHAAVEEAEAAGAPWAKALNADIWRFLESQTEAQAYQVAL